MGHSTDGAANVQGQYQGSSAFLSDQSPLGGFYAHLLNRVLKDTS